MGERDVVGVSHCGPGCGGAVRAVSRPAEAARSADGQAVHPERPVLQHSGCPYISESKRGELRLWTPAAKWPT